MLIVVVKELHKEYFTTIKSFVYISLSYDVAVIQWITLCYRNRMNTGYVTLWREQVAS